MAADEPQHGWPHSVRAGQRRQLRPDTAPEPRPDPFRGLAGAPQPDSSIYVFNAFAHTFVLRYQPRADQFSVLAASMEPRFAFGLGSLGHSCYLVGGVVRNLASRKCVRFDAQLGRYFADLPELAEPRVYSELVAHQGLLYAFGGADMLSVERLDPRTSAWQRCSALPRRIEQSSVRLGERVYFLLENSSRRLLCYDLRADRYEQLEAAGEASREPLCDRPVAYKDSLWLWREWLWNFRPQDNTWSRRDAQMVAEYPDRGYDCVLAGSFAFKHIQVDKMQALSAIDLETGRVLRAAHELPLVDLKHTEFGSTRLALLGG